MELRLTGKASSRNTSDSDTEARKAPSTDAESGNTSNSHSASGPCREKRTKWKTISMRDAGKGSGGRWTGEEDASFPYVWSMKDRKPWDTWAPHQLPPY